MEKPTYPFKKTAQTEKTAKRFAPKPLRQLLNAESQYQWPTEAVLYQQIEAPPSLQPGIHVSDLSGLPSNLKEPHTKLRFATADEYQQIKDLPPEIVKGYLFLRNAHTDSIF